MIACHIKLLSLQDALNDCEKALEIDPNFLRAHQRYGNVQFLMKKRLPQTGHLYGQVYLRILQLVFLWA